MRRNAPLSKAEKSALMRILFKHNPAKRRKAKKRKLSKKALRALRLRNLRKARLVRRRGKTRSLRSYRALKRWASGQIGKHQTGQRGYVIVNRFGVRRRKGKKVKLPGLAWSGKKGTVAFRGKHHDPDFYGGSYEEFDTMFTNPKRIIRRRGKRYVVIANKRGRKVASFRIKGRRTRGSKKQLRAWKRGAARLRKYHFKRGSRKLAAALRKARVMWRKWKRATPAQRAAGTWRRR